MNEKTGSMLDAVMSFRDEPWLTRGAAPATVAAAWVAALGDDDATLAKRWWAAGCASPVKAVLMNLYGLSIDRAERVLDDSPLSLAARVVRGELTTRTALAKLADDDFCEDDQRDEDQVRTRLRDDRKPR